MDNNNVKAWEILNARRSVLKGQKIFLVPFDEKHLNDPRYLHWLQDHDVMKYIGREEYLTKKISYQEIKDYVDGLDKSGNNFLFAIETNPERIFIGTFKIGPINWYRNITGTGIMVGDKNWWGKGIATDALLTVFDFCFRKLNLHKVTGGCSEINQSMKHVCEKVGFKEEGYFREQDLIEGKRYGHYHYGILKDEYEKIKI